MDHTHCLIKFNFAFLNVCFLSKNFKSGSNENIKEKEIQLNQNAIQTQLQHLYQFQKKKKLQKDTADL